MSETKNGVVGGLGVGVEWASETTQGGNGRYAPISMVDFQALMNTPRQVEQHNFNLTERNGSGVINDLDYYVCSYKQDIRIAPYVESLGLNLVEYNIGDRFVLPYDDMFQGIITASGTLSACRLYDNTEYNNFINGISNNYSWTGIGSTATATNYDKYYFCWIGTTNGNSEYRGYFTFSKNNAETVNQFAWCIWNINKAKPLLGNFTTEKKPKTDTQKGIPSLPIGWAGNLVKKNLGEIPVPTLPTLGMSTTGALNVYQVSTNDLQNFMSEIFHVEVDQTEEEDALYYLKKYLVNGVHDFINGDLTKFVIDTHILPVSPSTETTKSNIHIGGRECQQSSAFKVTSDYVTVDYGTVTIDGTSVSFYDGASDLNGARYKLYLPHGIGYVDLSPSLVWCHTIGVKYQFNIIDGSCIAYVTSSVLDGGTNSVIGTYGGSSCVHLPMTGENYSRIISGMLGVTKSITSKDAYSVVDTGVNMSRPNITMSNSYNASSSFMGLRYPYLLIEKPTENLSANFYERNGAILNARYKLSDMIDSGFTKCANVDIGSLGNIKTSEKAEIKRLLEQGVYL